MATEPQPASFPPGGQPPPAAHGNGGIEMPEPTIYPFVLSLGVTLFAFGLGSYLAFSVVGLLILISGVIGWVSQLLPGRGHTHEERAPADRQPRPIVGETGLVEQLRPGMAGYRFRLPEKIHPISAGIWGGIVGGIVMTIPALLYGVISGKGFWFPVNLLAGMVLPGVEEMTAEQLGQFNLTLAIVAVVIHATISVVFGLLGGVLLPTLPRIPGGPIIWGTVVLPLLWMGVSYGLMGVVNPVMEQYVEWHYYLISQIFFGLAASIVVIRTEEIPVPPIRGPEAAPPPGGQP
jgi:hypothetical protein